MLLYQAEQKYFDTLDNAIYEAEQGLTLEEFLELGFNNSTLLNPEEEDTDIKDLFLESSGEYYREDLTEDMLNARVVLSSTYEDFDGYTCANIVLENEEDWKYFKELI